MAKLTVGAVAFLCCILSVGCTSRSSPQGGEAARQLTPAEARGREIYEQYCATCHRDGKNGPKLEGVFKKKYLPSGTPANDDRMRDVTRLGRATMPGFGNALSAQQIDDLIAYMHTL